MPATFNSFVPLIMWLSVLEVSCCIGRLGASILTFSPCYTYTSSFHLEAEAAFVFPQGSRDSGLHTGGIMLASCVESAIITTVTVTWLLHCSLVAER